MVTLAVKLIRGGSPHLPWEYVGLAADTKPTDGVPPGSTFQELDGNMVKSMFSGTTWYPIIDRTSITGSLANVPVELQASKPESASAQDSQIATTEKTYTKALGATQIEVYVESGYVRVRTDGQPCTSTTGEPIASGFGSAWQAESISVFFVQESIVTVVSR